jgi:putative ABC transport system permease protein
MFTALYLTLKEIWRNRGRFFLFSLVIALITILVLFIAALGDGLGNGNREYIEKLNGELIVYKANVDLSIGASRVDRSQLRAILRVPGVKDAGQVSFSSVVLVQGDGKKFNVALIGVEPSKPGEPPVVLGRGLEARGNEAIIDRNVALRTGYKVGDLIRVKSIQGTEEEFYDLQIVGISDGRQYSLQPSVIVSHQTFDRVKPGVPVVNPTDLVSNVIVVQLDEPANWQAMATMLANQVEGIQAVDRVTAYQNTPGYSAQQSTLETQRVFSLLIGVLVIGGFFQIQTLQKVPQIGVLKAIGASNLLIAIAALVQIVLVTIFGVSIGAAVTVLLSFAFPATIPIVFSPMAIVIGIASLMLIGPIGGMVSVRYALRVEPLTALGLAG